MARLTVKSVEAIAATSKRREIPDELLPGLYFIVQPSGVKSWAVRYRLNGRTFKHTLGRYPLFDLKTAREAGAKALRAVAEGGQPGAQRTDTVDAAVTQFIERHGKRRYRPRSLHEAERLLHRHVLANWRSRKLNSISCADVRALLDSIEAPWAANRTLNLVSKFFNWCVEVDLLEASPVAGIKKPFAEPSRDRVLTDDELRAVWRAADGVGYPFGSIVQLLALTGQRRGEVAGMRWDEIAGDLWTLPKERTKNARLHTVPLSRQAMAIIEAAPRISDFVFSANGEQSVSGFSNPKRHIAEIAGVINWRLHDLRRSVASGMARLGINLPVIEKVLNHSGGSFAGIVGVYQRHEYAKEKREALQQWADHVERLASATAALKWLGGGHDPRRICGASAAFVGVGQISRPSKGS
jgi:integrase